MSRRNGDVLSLFERALALTPAARPAFLEVVCAGDRSLLEQLQKMVRADEGTHSLLDREPGALVASLSRYLSRWEGRVVGPYRLIRELGHGGMGVVYLAERSDVGVRVAIKLVAGTFASRERIARFEYERRALARLEHPHIARFLDAGVAGDGTPWLAMEYVEGRPIDVYADAHCLTVAERLALMEKVGEAVADAHRNLLIHRDLKPSNVLVSDAGIPKLVDFGVAKLLFEEGTAGASITVDPALRPLTPEYASPEQVRGEAVTTASDVYQLGIMLHELVTGRRPSRADGEPLRFFDRAAGIPMVRPSALVTTEVTPQQVPSGPSARTAAQLSALRRTTPARLRRMLSGDLDTIIVAALQPDPARRYATISMFVNDLRSHREGRPVAARNGSLFYRGIKLVRRHSIAASMAAALVMIAAFSAFVLLLQARRIARERDRAQQVAAALERLVISADPASGPEAAASRPVLREITDQARASLASDPKVWGRILVTVGAVYRNMGQPDSAVRIWRDLVDKLQLKSNDPTLIAAMSSLGAGMVEMGNFEEGLRVIDGVLGSIRELPEEQRTQLAESLYDAAFGRQIAGDDQGALDLYDEVLAVSASLPDSGAVLYDRTLLNLGYLADRQGHPDSAESLFQRALRRRQARDGFEHERTLNAMGAVARMALRRGDVAAASGLADSVLAIRRRLFTAPHPTIADALDLQSYVLMEQGRLEAAEINAREAHRMYQAAYGPDHFMAAYGQSTVVRALERQGRLTPAAAMQRNVVALYRAKAGKHHPSTIDAMVGLADLERRIRRFAQAETLYRNALPVLDSLRPDRPVLAGPLAGFGELLVETNRCSEAGPLLDRAVRLARQESPANAERIGHVQSLLQRCSPESSRSSTTSGQRTAQGVSGR